MTNPSKPSWAAAVERGVNIANQRISDGRGITHTDLYEDFLNSCQNVPLKWLNQFTQDVANKLA